MKNRPCATNTETAKYTPEDVSSCIKHIKPKDIVSSSEAPVNGTYFRWVLFLYQILR